MASPNIKLQTVYRFKEVGKSCLDKNYNYDGGYPCSGYQQLAGTYEVEDLEQGETFEVGNNSIQVRECLK